MSKTAETLPGFAVVVEPKKTGLATSISLPFETVAKLVDLSVPLRRPTKCAPSRDVENEAALSEELAAWDAASDEDFEAFEDDLSR